MLVRSALSGNGPRYSIKKRLIPVFRKEEARRFLDSSDFSTVLRGGALIAFLRCAFGRVSAVANVKVEDWYPRGCRDDDVALDEVARIAI